MRIRVSPSESPGSSPSQISSQRGSSPVGTRNTSLFVAAAPRGVPSSSRADAAHLDGEPAVDDRPPDGAADGPLLRRWRWRWRGRVGRRVGGRRVDRRHGDRPALDRLVLGRDGADHGEREDRRDDEQPDAARGPQQPPQVGAAPADDLALRARRRREVGAQLAEVAERARLLRQADPPLQLLVGQAPVRPVAADEHHHLLAVLVAGARARRPGRQLVRHRAEM